MIIYNNQNLSHVSLKACDGFNVLTSITHIINFLSKKLLF
jgi:hypothetical protein